MRTRLKRTFNRAKYAASTAAGVGALVGATVGEKRASVSAVITEKTNG